MAARLPCSELGIKDIRVAVYLEQGAPRRRIRPARPLSSTNSCLLHTLAEDMDDPALSASLRRLSRHRRP